ncbi:hypothetical protein CC80DRAFT_17082 [Byssothecium circinans]|uniref:Uncharacterized protein n=1 Tax=Byssothecium circinans TaxID=147558 RepID=A0A6A5U201_9PLEO|nr:hypothetical protein CC80DRAFT_17082 [Byssothecium circinans]
MGSDPTDDEIMKRVRDRLAARKKKRQSTDREGRVPSPTPPPSIYSKAALNDAPPLHNQKVTSSQNFKAYYRQDEVILAAMWAMYKTERRDKQSWNRAVQARERVADGFDVADLTPEQIEEQKILYEMLSSSNKGKAGKEKQFMPATIEGGPDSSDADSTIVVSLSSDEDGGKLRLMNP